MSLQGNNEEQDTADAAERNPAVERGESPAQVPPTATIFNPPQPPPGESPPDKNASKWRENTKLGLEVFGVVLLFAYTWFSCLQWLQIRYTNKLTARALDGSDTSLKLTLEKMQKQIDAMGVFAANAGYINQGVGNAVSELTQQAGTAKSSYEDSVRPYVQIAGTPPPDQPNNASEFNFIIALRNFGSIPATKFTVDSAFIVNGKNVQKEVARQNWTSA